MSQPREVLRMRKLTFVEWLGGCRSRPQVGSACSRSSQLEAGQLEIPVERLQSSDWCLTKSLRCSRAYLERFLAELRTSGSVVVKPKNLGTSKLMVAEVGNSDMIELEVVEIGNSSTMRLEVAEMGNSGTIRLKVAETSNSGTNELEPAAELSDRDVDPEEVQSSVPLKEPAPSDLSAAMPLSTSRLRSQADASGRADRSSVAIFSSKARSFLPIWFHC
ncbi:hypothetical protein BHE74_00001565 [Ensete ventricosum]|nr:hypothetical protein BHE74_00001565 [Ensete ventricosum]